jgi:two-component system response regulator FixJ
MSGNSQVPSRVEPTTVGASEEQSLPLHQGTVYLVDDHEDFRLTTATYLRQHGYQVVDFTSALSFLASFDAKTLTPRCLVTDLRMPEMDGVTLQERLQTARVRMPIIFISGNADVPAATAAMRRGACEFLEKPFEPAHLVECIAKALKQDAEHCLRIARVRDTERRIATLTAREREVLMLLANGDATKEAANILGINPKTVFVHRARVMEKMGVDDLVSLSQLVAECKANSDKA